jgi:hypothetical protein
MVRVCRATGFAEVKYISIEASIWERAASNLDMVTFAITAHPTSGDLVSVYHSLIKRL